MTQTTQGETTQDFERKVAAFRLNLSFREAAKKGDLAEVEALLAKGADPLSVSMEQTSALHWAVLGAHIECVRLLKGVCDVHHADADGHTALHYAAEHASDAILRELLPLSDVEARSQNGGTPLARAAATGSSACVKALLEAGADFRTEDKSTQTPLIIAAGNGNAKCVRFLMDAILAADPDAKTSMGLGHVRTARAVARMNNAEPCVQAIDAALAAKEREAIKKSVAAAQSRGGCEDGSEATRPPRGPLAL
jgi:ankyrin repeat protein